MRWRLSERVTVVRAVPRTARTLRAVQARRRPSTIVTLVACSLLASLLLSACASAVTVEPDDDARLARGTAPAPGPSASEPSDELAGLQDALDAVADAFLAKDPEALRPWLDDPGSAFGSRWLDRARNLEQVPLASYALDLDRSLPDLATEEVRERVGEDAKVVYVVEELAIEGFDREGPAAGDLFLTVIRRDDGWRIVGDTDAERLGLVSADHLFDHGPVLTRRDGGFLALYHQESAGEIPTLLAEARAAVEDVRAHWALEWDQNVPLIVPRDEDELAELLHVTFDLSNFIAFATATPTGELGDHELTGSRIVLNPDRFLNRTTATRRRILAHELLHVATRPHSGPLVPAWVEEGLAQRLGEQRSTTGTDLLAAAAARGAVEPPEDADFTSGGRDRIFLSYQLAWSFADHLAARFGEATLAEFYRALGRGSVGEPGRETYHVDRAAREVFGVGIQELQDSWARSLR